jgi:hypothetical protein
VAKLWLALRKPSNLPLLVLLEKPGKGYAARKFRDIQPTWQASDLLIFQIFSPRNGTFQIMMFQHFFDLSLTPLSDFHGMRLLRFDGQWIGLFDLSLTALPLTFLTCP